MRARVQPGRAAAHHADIQLLAFEIRAINVGDFEFAALRRLEACGNFDDLPIVEIKPGDSVARFWLLGFFFNAESFASWIELDDAVALGVVDRIGENSRPPALPRRRAQFLDQVVTVKNIIAEHERTTAGADKFLADQKRLGNSLGLLLESVLEINTEARAVAKQVLKARYIFWCG